MTVQEVAARVQAIAVLYENRDDEGAHSLEDALYRDVLQFFADSGFALARTALQTQVMGFGRFCA